MYDDPRAAGHSDVFCSDDLCVHSETCVKTVHCYSVLSDVHRIW